jgi:hypothetical protein
VRVVTGTSPTITVTFSDDGETPVATTGVTVEVSRDDGTTIDSLPAPAADQDGHVWTVQLPAAAVSAPDTLAVRWTDDAGRITLDRIDVVGRRYVTVAQLRARPDMTADRFDLQQLLNDLERVEDLVEDHCKVAFVPRAGVQRAPASHRGEFVLDQLRVTGIRWARADGVALDLADVDLDPRTGTITLDSVARGEVVAVGYTHGSDAPPADLAEAVVDAVRAKLLADRSGMASRELSIRTEMGDRVFLAQPGTDRPTGIPEVDAVLNRYRQHVPGIA